MIDKKVKKGFSTEFSSSYMIEEIAFNLTENDIERIKKCTKFLKENTFASHIRIDIEGDIIFLDDEGDEVEDWRTIVRELIVFSESIYIYSESKYDSGDYFESEEISITELLNN